MRFPRPLYPFAFGSWEVRPIEPYTKADKSQWSSLSFPSWLSRIRARKTRAVCTFATRASNRDLGLRTVHLTVARSLGPDTESHTNRSDHNQKYRTILRRHNSPKGLPSQGPGARWGHLPALPPPSAVEMRCSSTCPSPFASWSGSGSPRHCIWRTSLNPVGLHFLRYIWKVEQRAVCDSVIVGVAPRQ
ncbi:MAG: hypothetical protein ACJAVJ_001669 [Planctomycetota bacterium]|jgi:hypothetical protein